jgi:hypothetical protein
MCAARTVDSRAEGVLPHAVAMLVSTHRRAAHYVPLIREAMAALCPVPWPVVFLTDSGLEPQSDTFVEGDAEFSRLLMQGLTRLRALYPAVTHVFYMLEDHCPLRHCDTNRLLRVCEVAAEHDLAAVSFPTYKWPWEEVESKAYPDGLVRTWHNIEIASFFGERFAVVPRDFFRYFQLQPTLWRLEYLERVCAAAIAAGKGDPWRFETLRFQDAEQHYISSYDWPTVHHGFLVQGSVNLAAVHYADRGARLRLRQQLIKEVVGVKSEMLLMLRSAGERMWSRIRTGYRRL